MKPQKTPPQAAPSTDLIKAEIEHNIPVKQPDSHIHIPNELKNPIATIKQFVEHDDKKEKELDTVLKDVNQSIKSSDDSVKKSKLPLLGDKQPGKKSPQQGKKNSSSMVIITLAIFVAVGLSVAAFYAFKQTKNSNTTNDNTTKATSSDNNQTSGSSNLDLSGIDDLSSAVQSKLDGLNDSQDFSSADLSDTSLGL